MNADKLIHLFSYLSKQTYHIQKPLADFDQDKQTSYYQYYNNGFQKRKGGKSNTKRNYVFSFLGIKQGLELKI